MNEQRRIGIVGAGAIGGWIAAKLALAGCEVSLLARGTTLEAIRSEGLRLTEAGQAERVRVAVSDEARQLGLQDLLILTVKAPAFAAAAEAAQPMIGPETAILPMLNGVPWWFTPGEPLRSIDPDGRIASALPLDTVIGCVVHATCSRPSPNHVLVRHADKLILGELAGGLTDRVAALAELFGTAGINVEQSEQIRRAIWYKLWGNATINPLSALTRATADLLLQEPAIRAFMIEAMEELAAIGAAIGCPISESGEDRMAVTARLGAFKTSMLQDVEAGRPIELEALVGAPREIARRKGVPAPKLDLIYAMARQLEHSLALRSVIARDNADP